jgi:GT2 family glycosyltransferase
MDDPTIHLVTILYKSGKGIEAFIRSLEVQTLGEWRLHVIDNFSPDNSLQIVEAASDPRILVTKNSKNLGFAKAANQGMAAALADGATHVVLLNNDTVLPRDFLSNLRAEVQISPNAVLAPRVMQMHEPACAWYAGGHLQRQWVFRNVHHEYDASISDRKRVDFAPGCCLLIPASVLNRVGSFDERYFVYWEDTDFCMRLFEQDIPIYYLPAISILHVGGASSGGESSAGYYRLYYESYGKLLRKHFGFRSALMTMARILLQERRRKHCRVLLTVGARMIWGILRTDSGL